MTSKKPALAASKSPSYTSASYKDVLDDELEEAYPLQINDPPIIQDDSSSIFLTKVQHSVMDVLEKNFKVHEINTRYGLTQPWWTSTWFKIEGNAPRIAAFDVMEHRSEELEPKAVVEDFEFEPSKWILRLINTIEGYDGRSIVGLSRALGLPIASIIKENKAVNTRLRKSNPMPYLRLYVMRDENYMDSRHREVVQLLASYENTNPEGIIINQHREFSLTEIVAPLKNWVDHNGSYKKVPLPPRMITIPTYHAELAAVQQGFPISSIFDSFENIHAILGRARIAGKQLEDGLSQLYPNLTEVLEQDGSPIDSLSDKQPIVIPDWLRKKK